MAFELLPIQREAVAWALEGFKEHKGLLLADSCGLGKTAPALDIIKRVPGKSLVIAPAYIVYNWTVEAEAWGVEKKICVIDSGKQIIEKDAEVYFLPYSRVINPHILKQLLRMTFDLMVLDESHFVKSWNSKRSRYILGTRQNKKSNLLAVSKRALLLSGTPILRSIEDLYNVIIRIAPEVLNHMTAIDFYNEYAARVEHTPWGVKIHGVKNEDKLKELLKPVMLRRDKIDNLPEKIENDIRLSIKDKALKAFLAEETAFLKRNAGSIDDLEKLLTAKTDEARHIAEIRQAVAVYKIPSLLDLLEDIQADTDDPILIFTYHKSVLKAVLSEVQRRFLDKKAWVISGATPIKHRLKLISDFQARNLVILIAIISAMRKGVNLQAGGTVIVL